MVLGTSRHRPDLTHFRTLYRREIARKADTHLVALEQGGYAAITLYGDDLCDVRSAGTTMALEQISARSAPRRSRVAARFAGPNFRRLPSFVPNAPIQPVRRPRRPRQTDLVHRVPTLRST